MGTLEQAKKELTILNENIKKELVDYMNKYEIKLSGAFTSFWYEESRGVSGRSKMKLGLRLEIKADING